MMLKSKSNLWTRLKYLYVLPLAALTVAAFARPEISQELKMSESAIKVYNLKDKKIKVFIDGVEVSTETIDKLNPKNIESISVLKDRTIQEIYGDEIDGVITIKTQKGK